MADSGRYIWKWSKKKIERKKKKKRSNTRRANLKKTLGKWRALLISEIIERKTEFPLTRQDMAGYDGCLNIKKNNLIASFFPNGPRKINRSTNHKYSLQP